MYGKETGRIEINAKYEIQMACLEQAICVIIRFCKNMTPGQIFGLVPIRLSEKKKSEDA